MPVYTVHTATEFLCDQDNDTGINSHARANILGHNKCAHMRYGVVPGVRGSGATVGGFSQEEYFAAYTSTNTWCW